MVQRTPQTRTTLADTADVVVKCAGLRKIFRDFWLRSRVRAVDAIDLEVRRGEVVGLLGPNGSGKSTTIKLILGLLHPTAGRIAVFKQPPTNVAIKKRIGYLPEESYLYRFLNARETLEYYGRLFHQGRRQRHHRIDTLLEMVGLDRVARRPVGEYSKGMQRRIGLAQALINDPDLLILDEPTTGLDPIGTRQIKDLIVELAGRGKTVLLCSHLLADVEDVCDRVAIMFGGKIKREGTVKQLLEIEDQTVITVPALDAGGEERVVELLEKAGLTDLKVNRPRKKLEALFLQIVHEAQVEGAVTSGAHADGKLADFLTAESAHMPESTEPAALIDELTIQAEPERVPATAETVDAGEPAPADFKRVDGPMGTIAEQGSSTDGRSRTESPVNTGGEAPVSAAVDRTNDPVDADLEMIDELIADFGQSSTSTNSQTRPAGQRTDERAPAQDDQTKTNVEKLPEEQEEIVSSDGVELPVWTRQPSQESRSGVDDHLRAAPDTAAHEGEQPDKDFLDALVNVEPVAEDEAEKDDSEPDQEAPPRSRRTC